MATLKKIAVYGGRGALGSACVNHFKNANWWVINVDLKHNDNADYNITLPETSSWVEQEEHAMHQIDGALMGEKLNAVVCVAGGWASGNAAHSLSKTADRMWRQCVWSPTIAASIAAKFMAPSGLLALTGAQIALDKTPTMIGYGMAKAAVHHLTTSLGAEGSGLPRNSVTVAILPAVLDTEDNRKRMSKCDFSSWTPPTFVAQLLEKWILHEEERPPNGCLVELITKNNVTDVMLPALEDMGTYDPGQ
ncbi:hypothetical protein PYW07_005977 [Mythimna separata]|uniref:Dihydropteridine reductase n=1 Tax=Mythimna separata TaxID=271217 RepID=A0AAD7YJB3_MYTSE|nr:hypothetical protein PYW07_005977 [Mythimna separata]